MNLLHLVWGLLCCGALYVSVKTGEKFWPFILALCVAMSFVNAFNL